MTMPPEVKSFCRVCGLDEAWHKANKPHHQFSVDGRLAVEEQSSIEPAQTKPIIGQADFILRALLVENGVISPEQLTDMEQRVTKALQSGSMFVVVPGGHDAGPTRSSGPAGQPDHSARD